MARPWAMAQRATYDLLRSVGRRVAEIRSRAPLTQAQLAERVAISLKYLQRVEAGRHDIGIRLVGRLASALGVRPLDLLRAPRPMAVRRGRPPRRPGASDRTRGPRRGE